MQKNGVMKFTLGYISTVRQANLNDKRYIICAYVGTTLNLFLSSKDLFSLQHVCTAKRLIQTLKTHRGVADQLVHFALTRCTDGASKNGTSLLSLQKVTCFKENG